MKKASTEYQCDRNKPSEEINYPKHRHNIRQIDALQMELDIAHNEIEDLKEKYQRLINK